MRAWDALLQSLEQKVGKRAVDQWLRPLKVVRYDACNLYLEAENSFQIAWFEEHIRNYVKKHFLNNNAHLIQIHFGEKKANKKKTASKSFSTETLVIESSPIDPSRTFSNFLIEKKNKLTVEFCKNLAPGAFNPLYLFGKHGVGKSHLLMAMANKLKNMGLEVFFVHAETFTEHVVKAIQSSEMQKFRSIYRSQDVLIIDDVHIFARRAATQEELFHTFNALQIAGKQIILASHLSPGKLEEIEPRLTSRFEWGILLELAPLSDEKFEVVLKNKARLHKFPLSNEIIRFILESFPQSPHSRMKALDALFLRHKGHEELSLASAEILLKDLLERMVKEQLTPERILDATSAYFGIRTEDILGSSRAKEYADPRKLAMFLCRSKLKLPYLAIGRIFNRDHSTVMTSIGQIEKKSRTDEISAALIEIEKGLN